MSIKCREVMTHPVRSAKTTDDVFFVARLMRESKLGFLPINDEKGRVVGVVTDRDLAMKVTAANQEAIDVEVCRVMSSPVFQCRPDDDIGDVEREMKLRSVRRIVVVDARGRAKGVVSVTDLQRAAAAAG